jgi:hypothetical protein
VSTNAITLSVENISVRVRLALLCLIVSLSSSGLFAQPTGSLKVRVVDGDGGFNDIRNAIGHEITVEVRDQNNHPVMGAEVTFTAPTYGPSGTFANGTLTEIVVTDRDGIAHSVGIKPNATEGRLVIAVVASSQGREGTASIRQGNTAAGSKYNKNRQKANELSGIDSWLGAQ